MLVQSIREFWQKFAAQFPLGSKFTILPHVRADADAICSALALLSLLDQKGYPSQLVLDEAVADYLSFIPGVSVAKVFREEEFDPASNNIFLVDGHERKRLGRRAILWDQADKICALDHHKYREAPAVDLGYIDANCSSASQLIYESMAYWQSVSGHHYINPRNAYQITTGIYADTGGLSYNLDQSTYLALAELVRYDLPLSQITSQLFFRMSKAELRARGLAMLKARFEMDDRLVWVLFRERELLACAVRPDELGAISSLLRQVDTVDLAIFMREEIKPKGTSILHVSIRSSDKLACLPLAEALGGGGHLKAAGAEVPIQEDIYLTVEKILKLARQVLADQDQDPEPSKSKSKGKGKDQSWNNS